MLLIHCPYCEEERPELEFRGAGEAHIARPTNMADISDAGLEEGLIFDSITPKAEAHLEFYAELPIEISVWGNYHEFGRFVSRLSALPRILTLHDISITHVDAGQAPLKLSATAKTYWYLAK